MKRKSTTLAVIAFSAIAAVSSQGAISLSNGVAYTQNFNSLASTGTSSTLPTDWASLETGTGANSTYTAGTGSGNTGDTYSFGTAAGDRAFGSLQSGTVIPTIGASFTNGLAVSTITVNIAYNGEQWRLGSSGRTDRLDFAFSTTATSLSGTYTSVDALDFLAPISTGTAGLLDGNLSANKTAISSSFNLTVAPGATFWLRWSSFDATGADDGLAIDDFTITAVPEPSAALLGSLGVLALLRRRRR